MSQSDSPYPFLSRRERRQREQKVKERAAEKSGSSSVSRRAESLKQAREGNSGIVAQQRSTKPAPLPDAVPGIMEKEEQGQQNHRTPTSFPQVRTNPARCGAPSDTTARRQPRAVPSSETTAPPMENPQAVPSTEASTRAAAGIRPPTNRSVDSATPQPSSPMSQPEPEPPTAHVPITEHAREVPMPSRRSRHTARAREKNSRHSRRSAHHNPAQDIPSAPEPVPATMAPGIPEELAVEQLKSALFVDGAADTTGLRSRRIAQERNKVKKRRIWKRVRATIVILVVLCLLSASTYFAYNFITGSGAIHADDDYPGPGGQAVSIVIEKGDVGATIGDKLVAADVVKTKRAFIDAFKKNEAAETVKPGTYTLKEQMSSTEAVAALLDEKNRVDSTVTVHSGMRASQLVEKIASVTKSTPKDVQAAMDNPQAIGLPEEAQGSAEGWLAPGTYEVGPGDTPETVVHHMIDATVGLLTELEVPNSDWETVLIKASIIEREVNIPKYLPKVARVIENRLDEPEAETRGYLNMDSTLLYASGKIGGIPSEEDRESDNPYNTYLHPGLPPTPIAQPSRAAIEATLNPEEGPWLYFVAVDLETGETRFATTKEEHEANVALLTAYCEANADKCTKK